LPHLNGTTAGKQADFYFWWRRVTYDTVSVYTIVGMAKPTEHRSRGAEKDVEWIEQVFRYKLFMQKMVNPFVTKGLAYILLGN
jgi:hypothetical protein